MGANRILQALLPEDYSLISRHLELVHYRARQHLLENGAPAEHIYFPLNGCLSVVIELRDGHSLEVAMVGNEGCFGAPALVGLRSAHVGAIVQAPSALLRIPAEIIRERLPAMRSLYMLLARCAVRETLQVSQVAACTQFHRIEQRLARWLLVCRAKTNSDLLPFTQEFLADMLGTGRPSVTIAAGALQKAGFITYTRGTVRIVNLRALQAAACDCYRIILQLDATTARLDS